MIRDISAHDIVAGNKKTNLRQLVERKIEETGKSIAEIRYREIRGGEIDIESLVLETLTYKTTATDEYFLQWVTQKNKIAGFLRLSLPKVDYVQKHQSNLAVGVNEAMIREVHVYGKVAPLKTSAHGSAQHLGLGKELIKAACGIAKTQGFEKINVISSVGTKDYYRNLGFVDKELYQQLPLLKN
jgi:elongator complex protein 3